MNEECIVIAGAIFSQIFISLTIKFNFCIAFKDAIYILYKLLLSYYIYILLIILKTINLFIFLKILYFVKNQILIL